MPFVNNIIFPLDLEAKLTLDSLQGDHSPETNKPFLGPTIMSFHGKLANFFKEYWISYGFIYMPTLLFYLFILLNNYTLSLKLIKKLMNKLLSKETQLKCNKKTIYYLKSKLENFVKICKNM